MEDVEKILCTKKDLRRLPYTLKFYSLKTSEEKSDKQEEEQEETEEEEEKIFAGFKEKIGKLFKQNTNSFKFPSYF